MAEVLGPSNNAQVLDLEANGGNPNTPAYAIYENGNPVRVLLFNYITDSSGANDLTKVCCKCDMAASNTSTATMAY